MIRDIHPIDDYRIYASPELGYYVAFEAVHDVHPEYTIEITFPESYRILDSASCTVDGDPDSHDEYDWKEDTYVCKSNAHHRTIKISNFVQSTITPMERVCFTVNKIVNPASWGLAGWIRLSTLDAIGGVIDTGVF